MSGNGKASGHQKSRFLKRLYFRILGNRVPLQNQKSGSSRKSRFVPSKRKFRLDYRLSNQSRWMYAPDSAGTFVFTHQITLFQGYTFGEELQNHPKQSFWAILSTSSTQITKMVSREPKVPAEFYQYMLVLDIPKQFGAIKWCLLGTFWCWKCYFLMIFWGFGASLLKEHNGELWNPQIRTGGCSQLSKVIECYSITSIKSI